MLVRSLSRIYITKLEFFKPSQGTGCSSDGSSCTTGGPTWNGQTPFSRAEFNWVCTEFILLQSILIRFSLRFLGVSLMTSV
jgi:hypothetical protein